VRLLYLLPTKSSEERMREKNTYRGLLIHEMTLRL
jgi:hypothetical protein